MNPFITAQRINQQKGVIMFYDTISKLAIYFTIAILSVSCTIPLKAIRTGPENPASVPKEFDPRKDTLLVVAISRLDNEALIDMKSTIKLDEELQKQYPYAYKIVSPKELKSEPEKYSDTSTYRFALLSERRLVKQKGAFQLDIEEGLSFVPGYKATYIDFAFFDRATKQRFPHSGTSTSVMKLAVTNLTRMINKTAGQQAVEKMKSSSVRNTNESRANISFIK